MADVVSTLSSSYALKKKGHAQIKTVVTDLATGRERSMRLMPLSPDRACAVAR
jgi:hypothetical protein